MSHIEIHKWDPENKKLLAFLKEQNLQHLSDELSRLSNSSSKDVLENILVLIAVDVHTLGHEIIGCEIVNKKNDEKWKVLKIVVKDGFKNKEFKHNVISIKDGFLHHDKEKIEELTIHALLHEAVFLVANHHNVSRLTGEIAEDMHTYGYKHILKALEGKKYHDILNDKEAKEFVWTILELEDNAECKLIRANWDEKTILSLQIRIHELVEFRTILNREEFKLLGGLDAFKEETKKFKRDIDKISEWGKYKDKPKELQLEINKIKPEIVKKWTDLQVLYGHPSALLEENRILKYLYERIEQKELPQSAFFFANPFRTNEKKYESLKKNFMVDPIGRLKASSNYEWFKEKLFSEMPTDEQLEEAMHFIKRCGHKYKDSGLIFELIHDKEVLNAPKFDVRDYM